MSDLYSRKYDKLVYGISELFITRLPANCTITLRFAAYGLPCIFVHRESPYWPKVVTRIFHWTQIVSNHLKEGQRHINFIRSRSTHSGSAFIRSRLRINGYVIGRNMREWASICTVEVDNVMLLHSPEHRDHLYWNWKSSNLLMNDGESEKCVDRPGSAMRRVGMDGVV